MDGNFSSIVMSARRIVGIAFWGLSFALLYFASATPKTLAQDLKVLSDKKDFKTPIYQIFYPERNETVVTAPVGSAESMKWMGLSAQDAWRLGNRELVLWEASYAYSGQMPTRPGSVKFTFFVTQRKDKYKKDVNYTLSIDNKIVQQGNYVLEQQTFEGNGKQSSREVLTVTVPTEVFISISRAKKAEMKIGPGTYKFNDERRKHLSLLANTLEQLSK